MIFLIMVKPMIRAPSSDTDYFDIVVGHFQGDT